MRKHGWQLPYHPLQVVAVAVFLALGFAFYVFFAPFLGKQMFQYIAMGIYTPMILSVFGLYIWCAAADPADPGVFKSKKYRNFSDKNKKTTKQNESKLGGESTSSIQDDNTAISEEETKDKSISDIPENKNRSANQKPSLVGMLALLLCAYICKNSNQESCGQQMSEDGMFYCSLCEVEVFKYSKHCRVCDKCVDCFDHHCRWLNNCIGKRNYRKFVTLMMSALLLLIFQWSTGILVLICCFVERKRFPVDISSKLGSSFTVVPFVIVVAGCTILAMIATLPLAQLLFFHILLIKKGISTYDYIIALREQEQGGGAQQSPAMSPVSSITRLSSASSFNTFHRAAWCTPPRLFLEDQFDVVPPDTGSVSSLGKRTILEEPTKKKNPPAVKISPWTLARLNPEDVSKAVAEARKKSKILRPVTRPESSYALETDSSLGSSGRQILTPRTDNNNRKKSSKRIRLPADIISETSTNLAPLQFETKRAIPGPIGIVASSPESSIDYPSDGYDASGGEDSDQVVPARIIHRSSNWSSLLLGSEQERFVPPTSSSAVLSSHRKL